MKRTDSGFHESIFSNIPQNESAPVQRSNTAPTRRRNPITTSSVSISSSKPMMIECQRPGSEHPSRPFNQRSGASSSRNSTDQSRGRHPSSSKACSRGTSRTGVDPSRPSRHYRIQSSHTAPVITSRDIDDPVALHFRSCSLFQNPSYHAHSALPSPALSHQSQMGRPSIASRFTDDIDVVEEYAMPKQSEEAFLAAERLNATMHWTSPGTRQQEYKRIDKANSGIRGLVKRVMPRCVSGPQERFYENNQLHAGSVRRYRLDDDDEKSGIEKQLSSAGKTSAAAMRNQKKKIWGCF